MSGRTSQHKDACAKWCEVYYLLDEWMLREAERRKFDEKRTDIDEFVEMAWQELDEVRRIHLDATTIDARMRGIAILLDFLTTANHIQDLVVLFLMELCHKPNDLQEHLGLIQTAKKESKPTDE